MAAMLLFAQLVIPIQSAYATNNNNSGDIKVHEPGTNSELNNNDPQLSGCSVQVDFYNFNNTTPKNASVSFTSQAPTASAVISVTGASLTPIVEGDGDADGQGNNDLDGSYVYNLSFTGTPAAQGYHVDLDVVVGNPNGGSKQKIFWAPASCRANVTATVPTSLDLCAKTNDTYTIPTTAHVIYKVGGVTKAAGTYSTGGASSVTVTAQATDGYALSGTSSWTLSFTNVPCTQEVPVPPTPEIVDPCGLNNASWVVPVDTAVYDYTLNQDGSLSVSTKAGYTFSNGETSYNHGKPSDNGNYCVVPVPPTPSLTDLCNTNGNNATWNVPASDNTYSWAVNNEGHLIVTVLGDNSFDGNVKTHDYGVASDSHIVCAPTGTPTKSDSCGTKNDTYTIPATTGIDYIVNNQVVAAGTYAASGTVTVTAVPQNGFELQGTSQWTVSFTDEYCEPDVYAYLYTYCDEDGQTFVLYVRNTTDSDQRYEMVVRDSDGNIIDQDIATFASGQDEYGGWTATEEGDYTIQVYSYNTGERGDLLWERDVSTQCAEDTYTPEIYKRDQFGNLLPGAKFTIELCQYADDSDAISCETYTDVDLGLLGDWFSTIDYEKYAYTEVTITETKAPETCVLGGPWTFTWDYDYHDDILLDQFVRDEASDTPVNSGSWDGGQVWDLENTCSTEDEETPPVKDVKDVKDAASVVAELPHTGPGGTFTTLIALISAIVTYGAVYFAQPKRSTED